ncbi:hypothetical protein EDC04DRAFT_3004327 [Pisolithus marmoratus]|nr:hypothetical protein EDC04DRAFT_3004327 [Pisolithus marmoratus]
MASYKNFGNAFWHEHHTGANTPSQLSCIQCDPNNVERYFAQCKQFRLNGVMKPFWQDWALSDPANFLLPEPLHHWYHKFWDHDVQWCKNALSSQELDFHYSVLHPIVGMHHFKDGTTTLKQVTSQAQRGMQRYMIAVIGGAASRDVVTAIHALMDFQYLAQAPHITSIMQDKINAALLEFHNHKNAITEEGLQRGTESGSPLDHWLIPKLELMQSVALSISKLGAPMQWSADTTEHAHIEVIKEPASTMNKQSYDAQICHYLDHVERCQLFKTATRLGALNNTDHAHNHDDLEELATEAADVEYGETNKEDDEGEAAVILDDIWSPRWPVPNFFTVAEWLRTALHCSIPYPVRTFASRATALHLNYKPLLHTFLLIWYKVHLQQKSYHNSGSLQPVFTVNAQPPGCTWKYGHHDAAILQVDAHHEWPSSGLTGHAIVDVHLIMCPLSPKGMWQVWDDRFLVYVWQFNIVPQQQASVDRATGLHILKQMTHESGEFLGDIFPLDQIKSYAHLVPRFGEVADTQLMSTNSFHSAQSFWLNHYFDKDFYYALSL